MADVSVVSAQDMEYYQGDNAIAGIHFRYAGKALGLKTLGANLLELGPNCTGYPEHDHERNGEEELYVLVSGQATLQAAGREWSITPGTLVRVGPSEKRKFVTGEAGALLLALSNIPD